jgi:predicted phosphodiesterase
MAQLTVLSIRPQSGDRRSHEAATHFLSGILSNDCYLECMRIAVLADIHGNLLALEAVLADLRGRSPDYIINLGDCVSGPLWPRETAEKLIGLGWPTVRGNHDRWVTDLEPDKQYSSDAFARRSLSTQQLLWLSSLPPTLGLAAGILACHGRPKDDDAYMLENVVSGRLALASRAEIAERTASIEAQIVLCGHSHIPRIVRTDSVMIVNPGSVGQPAYEDPTQPAHVCETGSPHASYAIVSVQSSLTTTEMISVPYDHVAAAECAEENGSSSWGHFLRTGFASHRFGPP